MATTVSAVASAWHAAVGFYHDMWRTRARRQPLPRRVILTIVRVIVLSVRGFMRDNCLLHASALTYYTLLSVVPVFAMAFGIAKGFRLEDKLNEVIATKLEGQQEVVRYVTEFAQKMLQDASGGVVAGIGVLVLFWSVISLMGNIERSLNTVWGVSRERHIGRKFSDYLSFILLAPLLFVATSSLSVAINKQVTFLVQKIALLGVIAPLVTSMLKLTSYVMAWVLFTFIYMFMPNTRVRFRTGMIGGIVGGTLFVGAQLVYVTFQVGVSRYNAVYGSFAALPLFLVWLQLSWAIVLFGAELTHACDMTELQEFARECENASHSFRSLVALRVAHLVVTHFVAGEKALNAREIAETLELPVRLANETLESLTGAGILSEVVSPGSNVNRFQPARDAHSLTVASVVSALGERGLKDVPFEDSQTTHKLADILNGFSRIIDSSPANVLLKDV
ncbi:YihY/virulence factor BrkB family protein [bacterium]|nr:YihY/virulence factor BrkB family protein [bacterium]